jgi:hypothetical protein
VREEWDEALELEEVRRDKDGMSDVDAAKEDWEEEVITDFVRRKRPDEACFKFDISRTGYKMAQIRLVWVTVRLKVVGSRRSPIVKLKPLFTLESKWLNLYYPLKKFARISRRSYFSSIFKLKLVIRPGNDEASATGTLETLQNLSNSRF